MKDLIVQAFQSAKINFSEDFRLELKIERAKLFGALINKINEDIKDKIEQDVEILSIDFTERNTIDVKGRASAIGIKKEFVVHSVLEVNKEREELRLKVNDISIDGGFLVQKGFRLIEQTIREKIEQTAKFPLGQTLRNLNPSFSIPGSEDKLALKIDSFDLEQISLDPVNEHLNCSIVINKANISVDKV